MKVEAKIGLFITLGILALFALSTQVTTMGKFSDSGYELHSYIDDATGLEVHSKVLMNGVNIGEITEVLIEGRRVKVIMKITEGVQVASDSTLLITQESVLGAKTINLVSGTSEIDLLPSGEITKFHRYAAFDETSDSVNAAAEELKLLMKDFREVIGSEQKAQLKEMIRAFKDLAVNLDSMVVENRNEIKSTIQSIHHLSNEFTLTAATINADLPSIMKKVNNMTTRLDSLSIALESKLPKAVDEFIKIEDNVSTILEENRNNIHDTLVSANGFFNSGEEAFDKVDSLLSSFTVSELQVGIHLNYMANDSFIKSYGTIAYLPNPETYYLLDIISLPDYTGLDVNNTFIAPKKHESSKLLVSAQYAKRYNNLLLRGGVIESSGGVGIDYFANNDKFKVGLEIFDWNAQNDVRGSNPHLHFSMRYRFLKHIEMYAGYDNFMNEKSQNVYFGLGAKFIDNNLKYLLGSASMAR